MGYTCKRMIIYNQIFVDLISYYYLKVNINIDICWYDYIFCSKNIDFKL
jgi:hypothetical protein